MDKMIEEMVKEMLEISVNANVEPALEIDGKKIVLSENLTIILNKILEQAFIPYIAEHLAKKDYRKVIMCKDCKISDFGYFEKEIGKEAIEGYYCRKYREMKLPNDFCSDGVMKGI